MTQMPQNPCTEPFDSLLTPDQAAAMLAVAPATLEKWRVKRRGPPYRKLSDRVVRYLRADLEAFIVASIRP